MGDKWSCVWADYSVSTDLGQEGGGEGGRGGGGQEGHGDHCQVWGYGLAQEKITG